MSQKVFKVAPIKAEDVNETMDLLKRTFYIDEPLNKAVELCADGTCPELDQYCTQSLLEGLSFKAVDGDNKIVGVTISGICPLKEEDDGNDILSQARRCRNKKFQKILYILARREQGARLWEKFPEHLVLVEVKVASTDPMWRRRGIMRALVKETETAVLARGMRLIRLDTSSAYSAMLAEKLGFSCIYKALYTDLTMDGKPLIVPEYPHVDDRVYIKILQEETEPKVYTILK